MNISLSNMCKAVRERMKLSQTVLARMIGSNQTEVSFIERGFIPEDPNKTLRIKKLFEESLSNGTL